MSELTLFWFNAFGLFYLLATTIVFIRNRFDLTPLPKATSSNIKQRKISVCIPARNEEAVIGNLLQSVCNQNYQSFEILVLDDQSTDKTPEIIQSFVSEYPDLITHLKGKPKSKKWFGKPWACQQLADAATGEILLFLDADTQLEPDMLAKTGASFDSYSLDMLTVWPRQILGTFWERTVIPLVYYVLVTLLPAIYVYRSPRWMPSIINKKFKTAFAAACGQCIAFTREAYDQIGGHQAVKQDVVEDVALAKRAKLSGLTLRMFQGVGSISCRMYRSEREMFEGLRKNFLAGFGKSLPFFVTAAILHFVVFVLPFITLVYSLIYYSPILFSFSVASITIIFLHRLILSVWFIWNPVYGLLHPLGVLWYQWLGLIKIWDHLSGKKITWKGREVS
ncbi:MAG: glycosyltransferase family 2 protein [Balneolaceae bacterium]